MSINIEIETVALIEKMRNAGYVEAYIRTHELCYDGLRVYLSETAFPFSLETGIKWLEIKKAKWKHLTYTKYRLALYRLVNYIETGNIERASIGSNGYYKYHDTTNMVDLPDGYKVCFEEFCNKISGELSSSTVRQYTAGAVDFVLFIDKYGCKNPTFLTIKHLLNYTQHIRKISKKYDNKKKCTSGVNSLLGYFCEKDYIPSCYTTIIHVKKENSQNIIELPKNLRGNAFQPSKTLDKKAEDFLLKLENHHYSKSSMDSFKDILNDFFKFLEINCLEYSWEAAKLWLDNTANNTHSEKRGRTITMFDKYIETSNIIYHKKISWKPQKIDLLPDWSRNITNDFLSLRRREGWANTTVVMSRSCCLRFFTFLERKGISCPSEITPVLVKEFHDTEQHSTPQSGNMYNSGVRKLLIFMAEQNLVPQNLYLAISTQCAAQREIVSVMNSEIETDIFDYHKKAESPMELRNTAIIMIGMRMGLRASDIVNLKITDFDFKRKKISIIQQKTKKVVTLPVPNDVGNSIYRYIMKGRPQNGTLGAGYIFIGHKAPFSNLSYAVCRKTINEVLALYGLELSPGDGFHITRKTFATNLVKARANLDDITDALGHAAQETIASYISHDEDGMRLCPLPFTIGGGV